MTARARALRSTRASRRVPAATCPTAARAADPSPRQVRCRRRRLTCRGWAPAASGSEARRQLPRERSVQLRDDQIESSPNAAHICVPLGAGQTRGEEDREPRSPERHDRRAHRDERLIREPCVDLGETRGQREQWGCEAATRRRVDDRRGPVSEDHLELGESHARALEPRAQSAQRRLERGATHRDQRDRTHREGGPEGVVDRGKLVGLGGKER